ncbi:anhydro-N-acetylmuramic acid kinase [Arcticibacter pallidicorallinus]|uniref:Anhydro-N-acetylmuramic acid kinase n=1 Tax=Arcticibacter pallidicorallinus TaxID=1259464 RepID=A0A2T0U7Q0_9SPHI|nr:anhydro-N-acetylmuramic acid kinase [Arcticibacter pallidicorallinus]PRY53888.1 anhydro-N-acetylmuramic acid kinase [Arcticibacter pallidicorallinus]
MNPVIQKLVDAANKPSRTIIGLMSGTSMDGLDVAVTKIKGNGLDTSVEVLYFETVPFQPEYKAELQAIFCKETVNLQHLTLLNAITAKVHAKIVLDCLRKWNISIEEIDCIASHGQTIYHAPQRLHGLTDYPNATLQIGDGDHLAVTTGITTISDFRQKHVAAGGEGAPLALYGDKILFSSRNENRVLLNIGGISNFTYLPAGETSQSVVCTDCGPGNTLSDLLVRVHYSQPFDRGGEIALSGKVNHSLLNTMLEQPFFGQALPKTTGQELFNKMFIDTALDKANAEDIEPNDLIATVAELTASSIATCIKTATEGKPFRCYVSGGGNHNKYLMESLKRSLHPNTIGNIEDLGVNADAKESVLFALLANETICGSAINIEGAPRIMMGKISLPN